jgi:hypothetical protein
MRGRIVTLVRLSGLPFEDLALNDVGPSRLFSHLNDGLARHIVLNPQQVPVAKRSCRINRHLRNVVENRAPRIRPDPEVVRTAAPHRIGNFRRVFVQALELLVVPAKEVSNG